MNNKELIKRIKLLKEIQPRVDWQIASREILLKRISQSQEIVRPAVNGSNFAYYFRFFVPRFFHQLARPVGVIILISAMILGGGIITVGASQSSLPGDYLYPIKITSEKVQSTLSINPRDNLVLEIKFANRRLAEIQQINQSVESSDKKKLRVTKAADVLTQNLKNIQNNLKTIQDNETGDKAVAAATLVDEGVEQLNEGMEKEIASTKEVKNLIDETFNQTLDVWVDQYQNGRLNYKAKQDILDKVNVKIDQTGEKIRLVLTELAVCCQEPASQSGTTAVEPSGKPGTAESAKILPAAEEINQKKREINQQLVEAQKVLTEARKAMVTSDVVLAVNKLKQGKNSVIVAEQSIKDLKQSLTKTATTDKCPVDTTDLPVKTEINGVNNSTTVDLAPADEGVVKDEVDEEL